MDDIENSDPILLECVDALGGVSNVRTALELALTLRVGISAAHASELGARLEKAVAKARGEVFSDSIDDECMRAATKEINASVIIDSSYDIPYLAGYSLFGPKKIYIDRGLTVKETVPFLAVHEAVEKSLLDELCLPKRAYEYTHEIAQRLEQAAVEAAGRLWEEYQGRIMRDEIARARVRSAELERVPVDFDLTPYVDMQENELVERIKKIQQLPFVARKIFDGLYHIQFEDSERMALMMMRFQEFYESPEFRGKVFSREEFKRWYTEQKGAFTYAKDWGEGFNIPHYALTPFYDGKFADLTADESALLDFFSTQKDIQFYIIATTKNSHPSTLGHEIAHALFYLNPEYKQKVLGILSKIDTAPLKKFLVDTYGDYNESVLDDEVQAYLTHSADELTKSGFDVAPYEAVIPELQAVYNRYCQPRAGRVS